MQIANTKQEDRVNYEDVSSESRHSSSSNFTNRQVK